MSELKAFGAPPALRRPARRRPWPAPANGGVALALFAAVLWLAGCSCHQPHPTRASARRAYTNPVYAGSMPDPSVMRYGGVYYAFGTTGSERLPDGRIFTLLRSTNLVDWQKVGGALIPPSPNPQVQYWAPEITVNNGTFYLRTIPSGPVQTKATTRGCCTAFRTMSVGPGTIRL